MTRTVTRSAVIVDVVRTAAGARNGGLRDWHAVDLGAKVLQALVERNSVDPAMIDDVIIGCVMQVGEQALNLARNVVLAAGWPDSVPATTIDRQCGSSQQALHFAAQGVMAGAYDVVVAGGVETMSRVPVGASTANGPGKAFGPRVFARYHDPGGLVPPGISAELIADGWGLTRETLDRYSLESHRRAECAAADGRFEPEIVRVQGASGSMVVADECLRSGVTLASLSKLKPAFHDGGKVTAGNSAPVADCASAALIMSEEKALELGLRARARFVGFGVAGADPRLMFTASVPATRKALQHGGLSLDQVDLFEVNETFAAAVLVWANELSVDLARVNVNGGAIALGHPLGATGVKLLATLLNELERRHGRYGMQVMAEAGGTANALVIECLAGPTVPPTAPPPTIASPVRRVSVRRR